MNTDARAWITHYQADNALRMACGRVSHPGRWKTLNASRNWDLVTCKQCQRRKPASPTALGAKVQETTMNDKPRIGRPPNQAGHLYRTIGVSGAQHEIAAVLDNLTPRERMEAMLATIRDDKPAQGEE